mmetsp:Transcript_10456/g.40817  ORF Transcript_10456/g.40817 Transcript_10456/m.40817 type:complete len:212 (-) Transcript_10456:2234-2869(-)
MVQSSAMRTPGLRTATAPPPGAPSLVDAGAATTSRASPLTTAPPCLAAPKINTRSTDTSAKSFTDDASAAPFADAPRDPSTPPARALAAVGAEHLSSLCAAYVRARRTKAPRVWCSKLTPSSKYNSPTASPLASGATTSVRGSRRIADVDRRGLSRLGTMCPPLTNVGTSAMVTGYLQRLGPTCDSPVSKSYQTPSGNDTSTSTAPCASTG